MRLLVVVYAIAERRILDARTANQVAAILGFGARLVAAGIEGEVLVRGQCENLEASLARAEVAFRRDGGTRNDCSTAAAV